MLRPWKSITKRSRHIRINIVKITATWLVTRRSPILQRMTMMTKTVARLLLLAVKRATGLLLSMKSTLCLKRTALEHTRMQSWQTLVSCSILYMHLSSLTFLLLPSRSLSLTGIRSMMVACGIMHLLVLVRTSGNGSCLLLLQVVRLLSEKSLQNSMQSFLVTL